MLRVKRSRKMAAESCVTPPPLEHRNQCWAMDFMSDKQRNGRLMDECLNMNWFISLNHAREVIDEWRDDYHTIRLHSGLGRLTLETFRGDRETEDFQQQRIC